MKKILITAGDPSGDLIASYLVESLRKISPTIEIVGLGGRNLEKVCDRFLGDIVKEHALGFSISLKKIMTFRKILNQTLRPELSQKCDAVIPVDFYGFNSCVAKMAKDLGNKVFYYASPQFWASRPGRAEKLRSSVDLFLCLFPFEIDFYKSKNLPARFVGHPVVDRLPIIKTRPLRMEPIIGLFPGSRPDEITRHLPVMMGACNQISKNHKGVRYILFTVPHVNRTFYHNILNHEQPINGLVELVQDDDYSWRTQLDMALTASGMESFENALLGIPMVVIYKTNWITYTIARLLIQIPYIGMPNLLAGEKIVPEFIQTEVTVKNISQPLLGWIREPRKHQEIHQKLLSLREKFGQSGASDRAAEAIMEKVA